MISNYFREIMLISTLLVSDALCSSWTYTNSNSSADKWGKVANKMCDGVKQSPIALEYATALYDSDLKPIYAYQRGVYGDSEPFTMTNNGHTLMVSLPSCKYFLQLKGREGGAFCIKQFHFHWGMNSSVGSEHTINGRTFPLEMHVVAFDYELYSDFSEAAKGFEGLTVLGLLFHEDTKIAVQDTMLFRMGGFLKKVDKIKYPKAQVNLTAFPLNALFDIGSGNTRFYRYEGSLTTPPCTENVYWTVVAASIPVTPGQLQAMRYIEYPAEEKLKNMGNNFRSTREVNPDNVVVPRVVFRSWNPASRINLTSFLYLLLPIIMLQY
nr:carbonic anhydrase [Hymenolepis microstoma]